jgi:hypothetical protein
LTPVAIATLTLQIAHRISPRNCVTFVAMSRLFRFREESVHGSIRYRTNYAALHAVAEAASISLVRANGT